MFDKNVEGVKQYADQATITRINKNTALMCELYEEAYADVKLKKTQAEPIKEKP